MAAITRITIHSNVVIAVEEYASLSPVFRQLMSVNLCHHFIIEIVHHSIATQRCHGFGTSINERAELRLEAHFTPPARVVIASFDAEHSIDHQVSS